MIEKAQLYFLSDQYYQDFSDNRKIKNPKTAPSITDHAF